MVCETKVQWSTGRNLEVIRELCPPSGWAIRSSDFAGCNFYSSLCLTLVGIHDKIRTINNQEGTENLIGIIARSSESFGVNLAICTGCHCNYLDICTRTGNGHIYLGTLHILTEHSPFIIIGRITFIIPLSRGIGTTPTKCIATDNKILWIITTITYIICTQTEVPVVPVASTWCMVGKLQVNWTICRNTIVVREACPPSSRAIRSTDFGSRSTILLHKLYILESFITTSITTNGLVPVFLFHHVTDQGNIVDRYGVGLFGCQLAVSTYIYIR